MGDSSFGPKRDVKHKSHKSSRINRIVSLFEIPRPHKHKGLQRTNSLPASKRPSCEEESGARGFNTIGRVQKIMEEIEQKTREIKPAKTRTQSHKIEDKEKLMEDRRLLQERIEDVTPEIENSDTELEITHCSVPEDDVFQNNDRELLREKLDDEDSEITPFNRLSSETVIEHEDLEVSFVSYAFLNSPNEEAGEESAPETIESNSDETLADSMNTVGDGVSEVDSIEWWKHKSFVQINNEGLDDAPPQASTQLSRRFIKNNRSKRVTRNDRRRTGVLQKPYTVMELANHFENFKEAAESGETETYRKSFIDRMDKELENMKNDGFQEDFHLSMENLTLLSDDDDEIVNFSKLMKSSSDAKCASFIMQPNEEAKEYEDPDDPYGETLFSEDLEKGLYYLEAYNADGKELIVCSVQIDRRTVDLNSFGEMKARSKSNILANDERTLVLMEAAEGGSDSKRTTIYSTTSGESYEDEGIDIENVLNPYLAARRETYCDDQGVVRIERVAPYKDESSEEYVSTTNNYYYSNQEENANEEEEHYYDSVRLEHEILYSLPQVKKDRLQYILEEIEYTERKYVADLRKVICEYKTFLEERCPEKVDEVFANMHQIYKGQVEFLRVLEDSNLNVRSVVRAFIDFEDLFRLYPRYFRNTPKANAVVKELGFLIKEKQDRINDKLDLSAYLLTPLQRLGKYKLFLENISKQLEKENMSVGDVQMALEMVKKYMSKGNDAVAIASILHSPLHTKDYGSFIAREKFLLIKPRRLELMVFLFEGAIVFTTQDPKNMEQFIYHQSIKTNDLRIATFDDTTIHLTDYTKIKKRNSSKYTYVLDAKNAKLKNAWKQQIEDILWTQMQKIKENTLKQYQSGAKAPNRPSRTREQRSKSTGSSIFYLD